MKVALPFWAALHSRGPRGSPCVVLCGYLVCERSPLIGFVLYVGATWVCLV